MDNINHPSYKRRISESKPTHLSWPDYKTLTKRYYQEVETYDWTDTADNLRGPESFLHKYREWWLLKLLRPYLKSTPLALEVGCGTGLILRHLPAGSVGLDLNPRNLERLKKYVPEAKGQLCDVEEGIPYPDATFDLVVAAEVLEHLIYPEKVISEIFRVLKNGGVLVGSVPRNSLFWKLRFLSITYHSNTKHYKIKEPFHNEMSVDDLKNLLGTSFNQIKVHPTITNIFFVAPK
ncbi:MAG: class I SAM-dependent methyltransferase [Patescibacteria group bacterium]